MRRSNSFMITAAVACCVAWPGVAGADDGWNIRLHGVWTNPDGETRIDDGFGESITTNADSAFGVALSAEYGLSDRVGVELEYLGASNSGFSVTVASPGTAAIKLNDDLGFSMIDASLNIRLTSGGRTELFVGPVLAQVFYDDLRFEVFGEAARLEVDDDFGVGLVLGADIALGDGGWFFSGRVKYIDSQFEARDKDDPNDPGTKVDFNPLMVAVGVGVRLGGSR